MAQQEMFQFPTQQEFALKELEPELMNMLQAEPSSQPAGGILAGLTAPGPDIPALCEQLAVLVLTGPGHPDAVNTRAGKASDRERS